MRAGVFATPCLIYFQQAQGQFQTLERIYAEGVGPLLGERENQIITLLAPKTQV